MRSLHSLATANRSAGKTVTGTELEVLEPSPSLPCSPLPASTEDEVEREELQALPGDTDGTQGPQTDSPQHMRVLFALRPHVWAYPAAMPSNVCPDAAATGDFVEMVVPSPN